MNRAIIRIIAVVAAPGGAGVGAQSRIGFIDSNRAVVSTDEGKAEYQKVMDWQGQDENRSGAGPGWRRSRTSFAASRTFSPTPGRDELIGEISAPGDRDQAPFRA